MFVLVFFLIYYKIFGVITNLALLLNLLLVVAVMSLLGATLTLPGLAGIALTVGMSVDANVLINERIREELRAGNTPLASIAAGYDKASGTIADANVTALLGGIAMAAFGSRSDPRLRHHPHHRHPDLDVHRRFGVARHCHPDLRPAPQARRPVDLTTHGAC